jgi:1,4-alpha-glucan branching enzyme
LTNSIFPLQLIVPTGYLAFVLHSHLPWVLNHGRWPHGADWLSEAAVECYIPLLMQLERLVERGYHPNINIGITPILQEQLRSQQFKDEFFQYIILRKKSAEQDYEEFNKKGQTDFSAVAEMWLHYFTKIHNLFVNDYSQDILGRFKALQDNGNIEIITSAATHGYLPLLKSDRSVNAQIELGVRIYKQNFGRKPNGIWLPECAYRPAYAWKPPVGKYKIFTERRGIDDFLSEHHINYFITDAHLLKGGKAIGTYLSRFKALQQLWRNFQRTFDRDDGALRTPQELYFVASNPDKKPVAVLTRDPNTALQVWSGDLGYPGDSVYLDFHKKRWPGGLRYWRVTDPKIDLALKNVYQPGLIEKKIQEHAHHFVSLIRTTAQAYYHVHHKPACICVPFDTELFGHWWFEGPHWLYYVLKLVQDDPDLALATGSNLLDTLNPNQIIALPEGSWGEGGFHYVWLNKNTTWTWKRLYEVEDEFYRLLDKHQNSNNVVVISFLRQLARELLLLQSSDWQFLITTWSARDYAELRFSRHYENFKQLASVLSAYAPNKPIPDSAINILEEISQQDNCFPDLDLSIFGTKEIS